MKWKSRLFDLVLAGIPLLVIGIPAWIHGPGHEHLIDETTLIAPSMSAIALRAPSDSDILVERFCAATCIVCSSNGMDKATFRREDQSCLRPEPALRIPAGGEVACRNECTMTHAVVVIGALARSS
ncbi:MAG: hypothetical protein VCC00_05570 [Deltaproteobacteria bacterium]